MIQINNLHFSYRKKKVFNGLSLQLQPGHIYGLLGKNGTGKSTLLRSMAGLLFPNQGDIRVLNFEPGKRQPAFLQDIFLVPEELHVSPVSIPQLLRFQAPFYPRFSEAQFNRYIQEFEVPVDQPVTDMSYGQKKKVLISFGLACNTAVLLMDEPTNGLDILSKAQFRRVMAGALDEQKCVVISTHQVKDLEQLIDRVTVIDEGQILFDQTMEAISRRLHFSIAFNPEEVQQALYSEGTLRGHAVVTRNQQGEESKPDLELLYKAIVLNGPAIRSAFTA
ncbi:MAG: ABC transporter ATP-binding protein [Candidatus Pseudobacter hemicellulosilyticus]|uniref:ABC transporter ATP-binding protein n=1 Tax=Candidatus Pseudobacter hemicellulosilyticus TaxID=3121375 RepID=A0AAJ5WSA0_9BACT|nr:MAG: ABC transporter ATP-binding protein [Pseudobacter sp.]